MVIPSWEKEPALEPSGPAMASSWTERGSGHGRRGRSRPGALQRGEVDVVAPVVLPVGRAQPFGIGLGLGCRVVAAARSNLVTCASGPHPLYIALATGAHQPLLGWAPPIRARDQGLRPLGL